MNNINQYIFDIDHVLAHLRDTLEFVLPREHDAKIYDQRKLVLQKGINSETPLGKFLKNNEEQFKPVIEKYNELLDEVYGDNSTILVKTTEGKIRVDHSQHIKIFQLVTEIADPIKDVLYYHHNIAKQKNENQPIVDDLLAVDDRYYRLFVVLLLIQEFQKSFFEFQKVMGESQGKPTPQSNFIVQNELAVMAKMLRDMRSKTRFTDNKSLDLYDNILKVVEMTEGRRDRIDNKPFSELFKSAISELNEFFVNEVSPKWRDRFDAALKEMVEDVRKNTQQNPSDAQA